MSEPQIRAAHITRKSPLRSLKEPGPSFRGGAAMHIAIVNNMPDSALVATERQFMRLVTAGVPDQPRISLYFIPALARGEEAQQILAQRYRPVDDLYKTGADAVIVTGNEPKAPRLDDEPYWPELTRLIDWVRDTEVTSLWSCLAAHAAVLHLDGIERRRLSRKKSGVLSCSLIRANAQSQPITICHSRLNGLDRDELQAHGYDILSEADGGHVDSFRKRDGGDFRFLQGHPEYDADSLMREYRRDVGRFLNAQRSDYPEVPENYFDEATLARMAEFRQEAERRHDAALFSAFPAASLRAGLENQLAASSAAVFADWLGTLHPAKTTA